MTGVDAGGEVDHPDHYNSGDIECIDALEAALTPEEFIGFCTGNAIKYLWRWRHKDESVDLMKARWYLDRAIGARLGEEHSQPIEYNNRPSLGPRWSQWASVSDPGALNDTLRRLSERYDDKALFRVYAHDANKKVVIAVEETDG